jgi:hypothetical protein
LVQLVLDLCDAGLDGLVVEAVAANASPALERRYAVALPIPAFS